MMAKKTKVRREWTATEIHKLKGLAKKKVDVDKIARTLKRTVAATAVKASALGVSLDTRA
jgi:translation initiation factor 1 (eIF-1/SUI1)